MILPIGLLPTTAFAADESTVAVAPESTVQAEVGSTATPTPTVPETAPATTAAPTATDDPKDPSDGEGDGDDEGDYGDYLEGTFSLSPDHGKPGTVVTVASQTKCVDKAGKVSELAAVFAFSESASDAEFEEDGIEKVAEVDSNGAWKTTFKVPAKAKAGDIYLVIAACFPAGTKVTDEDAEPFLLYDLEEFVVTGTDEAPVATPVAGNPNFTG
jgi:hypothetical protein